MQIFVNLFFGCLFHVLCVNRLDGDSLPKVKTDFPLAVPGNAALFALEGVDSLVIYVTTGWALHSILTTVVAVSV